MAEHAVADGGHPDMDYAEHERTYRMFIGFIKYGSVAVAIILILMAFFLI